MTTLEHLLIPSRYQRPHKQHRSNAQRNTDDARESDVIIPILRRAAAYSGYSYKELTTNSSRDALIVTARRALVYVLLHNNHSHSAIAAVMHCCGKHVINHIKAAQKAYRTSPQFRHICHRYATDTPSNLILSPQLTK